MKKILLIITLFCMSILPVYAEVETVDRNTLENYGVNKKWNITDHNKSNVMNTPKVDASLKIYDFSEVLTEEEVQTLKEKINSFIEKTNMDMVIVIPKFSYSSDQQNEDYAADFYDYNDFGLDFEKYSGVLFLRNTYDDDPYFNIYTFGEAQLYFDYDRLEETLDDVYDDIKSGNYLDGFSMFIDNMERYYSLGFPKGKEKYYIDENGIVKIPYTIPWILSIAISTIVTMIIVGIFISKNKMVKKATTASEYLKKDSVNITNKKDIFITSHTTSYTTSSSSGSGGGGSSFGSSGGGHSSGGGRHG